ncbi:MAG: hypothetical protein ACLFWF_07080 [Alphaproteobacteria bacterium]
MAPGAPEQNGYAINVIERRDVEDYASGHLRDSEIINRVEEALLEDDAAREVVRAKLRECGNRHPETQGLLFEALQDLHTTAHSCAALAGMYERLARHAEKASVSRFLEGRRSAFGQCGELLSRPLKEQPAEIPDTWPEQSVLLARESLESLVRQLGESPAEAIHDLDDLHAPVMLGLRTLVHLPWPLETKLLIADVYGLLRDELERGAWRLSRGAG